jgi:CRP-like cAMP-binding protein
VTTLPRRPAPPQSGVAPSSPLLKRTWRPLPVSEANAFSNVDDVSTEGAERPRRARFELSPEQRDTDDHEEEEDEDVVQVQGVVGLNSASSGDELDSPELKYIAPLPPGPPARPSHVPKPPKRPAKTEALRILTPSPLVTRTAAAIPRQPEHNDTPEDLTAAWVHKGRKAMLASLGVEDGGLGLAGLLQAAASTQFRSKLRTFAGGPPGVVYLSSRMRTLAPSEWKAARQNVEADVADIRAPPASPVLPVSNKKEQDASIEHIATGFSIKRYAASTNFVPLDQVQAWRDILQRPPAARSDETLKMLESACLSRVSLFSEAAPALRTFLLRHATYIKLAKGEELFHQRDPADGLYVILAGFAQIVIDMGQVSMADVELTDLRRFANVSEDGVINTLGPLEAFGEQGLLVFFRELLEKCYPDENVNDMGQVSMRMPRSILPDASQHGPPKQRSHSVDYTDQQAAGMHQAFRQRRGSLGTPTHKTAPDNVAPTRKTEETVQYRRFLHLLKATVETSGGVRSPEERGVFTPRSAKGGATVSSPREGLSPRTATRAPTVNVGSLLHPPISPRGIQTQRTISAMLDPPDGSTPLCITGGHRLATVLAAPDTDLHLLKIPAIPYLYLLARNRREVQDVATLALKQTSVFSFWPDQIIDQLSATAVRKTYRPGDVILKQGDEANGVFIILLGHCRVLREVSMSDHRRTVLTKMQQSSGSLPTSRSTIDRVPTLDLSSRSTIPEPKSLSELDEMRSARLNHLEALARPSKDIPENPRPIIPSLSKITVASSPSKPAPSMTVDIMRLRKLDTFGFADSILGATMTDAPVPTNTLSPVRGAKAGQSQASVRHGVRVRRKLQQSELKLQDASTTDATLAAMKRERRRSSLSAILDAVKNAQALGIKQAAEPASESVLPDAHTHAVIATPHTYSQSLLAETRVEGVFIPRAPVLLDACLADPVLAQRSWDAAVIDVPTDAEVTTQVSNAMSWNSYKSELQHTIFVDQNNRKAAASLSAVDLAETPVVPPQVYREASHDRVFNKYMSQLIESSATRRIQKTVLDGNADARQAFLKIQKQQAKKLAQSAKPTAQHFTLLPDDADVLASKMRKFVTTQDLGLQLPDRARRRSLQSETIVHLGPNPSIQSLAQDHDLLSQQSAATLVTIPSQELVGRLLAANSAQSKLPHQTRHIVLTPLPLTDSESDEDRADDRAPVTSAAPVGTPDVANRVSGDTVISFPEHSVPVSAEMTSPVPEVIERSPRLAAASGSNVSLKLVRNGSHLVAKHDARSRAVRYAKLASRLTVPADLESGRWPATEQPRSNPENNFTEYSQMPLSHVLSTPNTYARASVRPIVPTNAAEHHTDQSPRRRHAQLQIKKPSTFRRQSISVEMESFAGGLRSPGDMLPSALTSRPASPVRSSDIPPSLLTVDLHASKKHLFLEKFTVPSTFGKNKCIAGEGSFTDPPPFSGAYHALPLSSLTLGMSMPDLAPNVLKKVLSRTTMIRSPEKRTSAASLLQAAGQRSVVDK